MANIVMCRPTFFNVTRRSKTNRMMNPENPPDRNLAMRQWTTLRDSYKRLGLNVHIVEGQPRLEDMTFIANAGLSVREYFILSNFLEEGRRGEKTFNREYFNTLYGASNVLSLSNEAIFEGQGDALFIDRDTLLLGYGVRTNEIAVEELISLIHSIDPAIGVIPLPFRPAYFYPLNEKIFYHLDTCLLRLKKSNEFLVYPRPFKDEAVKILQKIGAVVEITRDEAECFVCNSVINGDVIFTPLIRSRRIRSFFARNGYKIVEHNMSEFIKSGGAVKCLTLEICD